VLPRNAGREGDPDWGLEIEGFVAGESVLEGCFARESVCGCVSPLRVAAEADADRQRDRFEVSEDVVESAGRADH
jgi:hypothetical protein